MFWIQLILISITSTLLYAGGMSVNNGGDAVLCADKDGNKTVELLDFFDNRPFDAHLWDGKSQTYKFFQPHLSATEQVHLALQQVERFSSSLAQTYRHLIFENIIQYETFVQGPLEDVADSYHIEHTLAGCSLKQVAVQENRISGSPRFKIDRGLFERMPATHQAGLLLHEAIYHDLFRRLHQVDVKLQDSTSVRFLVPAFFTSRSRAWTDQTFLQDLRMAGFRSVEIHGCEIKFYQNLESSDFAEQYKNHPYAFFSAPLSTRDIKAPMVFDAAGNLIEALSPDGKKVRFVPGARCLKTN